MRIRNSSTKFASFSCISSKGLGLPWRPSSTDSCSARRLHNSGRFRARRPACKYEQRARQHAPANLHAATDSASKPTVLDRLEGLHFFYVLDELRSTSPHYTVADLAIIIKHRRDGSMSGVSSSICAARGG